jgi:hypothetical protein
VLRAALSTLILNSLSYHRYYAYFIGRIFNCYINRPPSLKGGFSVAPALVLPQFLLKENKSGSTPRIVFVFYLLYLSILVITNGQLEPLAGVYTLSFLMVMIYFGYGNFLLKIKRSRVTRPETAPSFIVAIAVFAIFLAL